MIVWTGIFAGQLSGDLREKDYYCPANVDQSIVNGTGSMGWHARWLLCILNNYINILM
jgi:hypothetical protein